jgi:hypothetical protein
MIERRTSPRQRVFKHGTVSFGGLMFDVTVRNLSNTGAQIDVARPVGFPTHFTLSIESNRLNRRCRPVWSSQQRIGVAFE